MAFKTLKLMKVKERKKKKPEHFTLQEFCLESLHHFTDWCGLAARVLKWALQL